MSTIESESGLERIWTAIRSLDERIQNLERTVATPTAPADSHAPPPLPAAHVSTGPASSHGTGIAAMQAPVFVESIGAPASLIAPPAADAGAAPQRAEPVEAASLGPEQRASAADAAIEWAHSISRLREAKSPASTQQRSLRSGGDLEQMIGLNWTAWVGAVVFVLGVLFFLKYAWDQGWINPTPTMRVVASIITGIVISGIGEWMHRKRVTALAATLHGAGLAIVLASFFASYALFTPAERVLSAGGAMTGVAITAGVGIAIALHIDSVVLVIIAMIGAYAAPFVLNTGEDRSAELLCYLGTLSAVGWVLCYIKSRWTQYLALLWTGTFVSFTLWWGGVGLDHHHTQLATGALAFYYAGFLVEMILSLRKNTAATSADLQLDRSAAVLSLLHSAVAFGMLRWIYSNSDFDVTLGCIALAMAAIMGAAAFIVRSRAFSISALLQAAALTTLAAPLILDNFAITLAWIALAVALAAMAWELNLPAARGWAVVLLLLSIGRLFLFDESLRSDIELSLGGFTLSRWMMMAWGMAILAHVMAWMKPRSPGLWPALERRFTAILPPLVIVSRQSGSQVIDYASATGVVRLPDDDPFGMVVSFIGTALFFIASMTIYSGPILTSVFLVWVIPIVVLAGRDRALGYFQHAAILLGIISLRWFLSDELNPIIRSWNSIRVTSIVVPLLHQTVFNAILIIGLLGGILVQLRRKTQKSIEPQAIIVWMAMIVLATLNFEACRTVDWLSANGAAIRDVGIVKHVVMSVLWAAVGFIAIVFGFRNRIAPLRYAALVLLGITLLKILLVDMAEVKAVWRILSFVAVGALLLSVSYVYHRQQEWRRLAE